MNDMTILTQKITVANKTQLVVAVGCAIDFIGITKITLRRKTGTTTYILDSHNYSYPRIHLFNERMRKIRGRIRRTPAECFK